MMVSILIVNYFTAKWLPALLDILLREPLVEEVLILNNSPAESLDHLRTSEKVHLLDLEKNLGFGKAMNRGVKEAKGDWWLLLNPDTLPVSGFLAELVQAAEAHQVLMAGPRFYWDEEQKWQLPPASGATAAEVLGSQMGHRHALEYHTQRIRWQQQYEHYWQQDEPFYQPFLSGACLLIRNAPDWFPGGKIFDERFFLYYEDTDLAVRCMLARQPSLCVPQANVIHFWDQAPREQKNEHESLASQAFWDKYYPELGHKPPLAPIAPSNTLPIPEPALLGEFRVSPRFTSMPFEEDYRLEVGLSPLMVPFVQRQVEPGEAWLSDAAWDRLAAGTYFAQIRQSHSAYPLQSWTWKKA